MKIRPLQSKAVFVLLILPFFKLAGMSEYRWLSALFDALFLFSALVTVLLLVRERFRMSALARLNWALQGYLFVLTAIRGGLDSSLVRNTLGVALAVCLLEWWLLRSPRVVLEGLLWLFAAYALANAALGHGGLFQTYLFGQRTTLTVIGLPMMAVACYAGSLGYQKTRRLRFWVLAAAILLGIGGMMVREAVSTALLGAGVALAMVLLLRGGLLARIRPAAYVLGIAGYNFVIVGVQQFSYMRFLIETVLGKSMTLTGRLSIWNLTLAAILRKPVFGYGFRQLFVSRGAYATATAYVHNNFLQFWADGGIIGLALFLCLLVVAVRRIPLREGVAPRLLFAWFVGMGMAMISEAMTAYNYFYLVLVLLCHLEATLRAPMRRAGTPPTEGRPAPWTHSNPSRC